MRSARGAVCCSHCARSSTDRASDYGSEGWGFESLRARYRIRRSRPYSNDRQGPWLFVLGPAVSQFLTVLSDLVNLGERGLPALQVFLARVDVGLLRERRVIVTGPLADDRDRYARVLTGRERITNHAEYLSRSGAPGGYSRGWWLPVRICPAVSQVQARSVCRSAAAMPGGPRPRRTAPSACRVADGRAGGRADIGLRGRDASRATRAAGCQVGRVARPVMRRSGACLAAAVPAVRRSLSLAMMRPMHPAAPGCIAVPAGATMMRATQRNQLHHRCISSRRTVTSQVTAAAPPARQAEGTAGPHAAPQAARVHANCRMLHPMQLRALLTTSGWCAGSSAC